MFDSSTLTAISQISGWTLFLLLVVFMIFSFVKDWMVTRGAYNAMKDLLTQRGDDKGTAADKWEALYRSEHEITTELVEQAKITSAFFSEVTVTPKRGILGP